MRLGRQWLSRFISLTVVCRSVPWATGRLWSRLRCHSRTKSMLIRTGYALARTGTGTSWPSLRRYTRLQRSHRKTTPGSDTLHAPVQSDAQTPAVVIFVQSGRESAWFFFEKDAPSRQGSGTYSRTTSPAFKASSSSSVGIKSSCTLWTAVLAGPPASAMAAAP